jgi:hypothetical protein
VAQSLFAPWRFKYVTSTDKRIDGECVLCRARRSQDDRATFTLWRWQHCFALLNLVRTRQGTAWLHRTGTLVMTVIGKTRVQPEIIKAAPREHMGDEI